MSVTAIDIVERLRVQTESSLWLFEIDRYMRLPLSEAPRLPEACCDGALDDARWLPHRGVGVFRVFFGLRLRILPAGRDDDSDGVVTGVVVAASCDLEALAKDPIERG